MNTIEKRPRVLLDDVVLARLREELEPDTWICDRFVHDYIAMMPSRLGRLDRTIHSMDFDAALDAVLSLKTSSMMIGASLLGAAAANFEAKLKLHTPGCVTWSSVFRTDLELIRECSLNTITELTTEVAV